MKKFYRLPKISLPKELKKLFTINTKFKRAFNALPEITKRDYVAYVMSGADSFRRHARANRVMAMVLGDFGQLKYFYQ